jgi:diguanylate cyclase (GGDEF)-like protein
MTKIAALLERLKENEEIAQKFHEIETSILSILNFRDLFEVLLTEIQEKFRVPYTWISFIAKSEVSGLVATLESSALLKERLNIVERDLFMELIGKHKKTLLVNKDIKPFFKLLPQNSKYFIKSIAVVPISLDGEIIGSLNQADFEAARFQPGMDTTLLERLALKLSLCLSNVTAHEKLKFLAFHDPLTGLLNRRVMESVLKREFSRAKRYQSPLAAIFIDLDEFKTVNDTYGHNRGDELLRYVADMLVAISRDSDVVARFAGDEFVIILPETTFRNAAILIKRLQTELRERPLEFDGHLVPVAISFGIATTEESDLRDAALLLKKADDRLYEDKQRKKKGPADKQQSP